MSLHEKLKILREKNGFTQEELASLLNISRQSISKWERGITTPDIRALFKLSKLYNVTMEHFIDSEKDLDFSFSDNFNSNESSTNAFLMIRKIHIKKNSLLHPILR